MNAVERLKSELATGRTGQIFNATYSNLLERQKSDGAIDESLSGLYPGTFCRTIGAWVMLLMEYDEAERAKAAIAYVFNTVKNRRLSRIPHVIGDGTITDIEPEDQIDGRAHVVMAYGRLCNRYDEPAFEDLYYEDARKEVMAFFDQPYLYYQEGGDIYNWACNNLRIVFNCSFEHSREYRRWSVFDLLTQSFVGAAGEAMLMLARKRGDIELSEYLDKRLAILKDGIKRYMTRMVDGKQVYLEMLIPDGNFGVPYTGMGWVCFSPIAAEWEALDTTVLDNTIDLLRKTLYFKVPEDDFAITYLEYDERGAVDYYLLSKCIGWDIEYCRRNKDYERILEWCAFLNKYHKESDLLMECARKKDGEWKMVDFGNAEQCVWWCWAVTRLKKQIFD